MRRCIKVGADIREPGDLVPEAITWRRVQHLVHSGYIVWTPTVDGELEDALDYAEPFVRERYGFDNMKAWCNLCGATIGATQAAYDAHMTADHPVIGPGPLRHFDGQCTICGVSAAEVEDGLGSAGVCTPCELLNEVLELPEADLPAEDSILAPTPDYSQMPWPELRKLGQAKGLGRSASKAEILTALQKG